MAKGTVNVYVEIYSNESVRLINNYHTSCIAVTKYIQSITFLVGRQVSLEVNVSVENTYIQLRSIILAPFLAICKKGDFMTTCGIAMRKGSKYFSYRINWCRSSCNTF